MQWKIRFSSLSINAFWDFLNKSPMKKSVCSKNKLIFVGSAQHYSISKISKSFLWICSLLGENLSNFVSPDLKLHNPYCHTNIAIIGNLKILRGLAMKNEKSDEFVVAMQKKKKMTLTFEKEVIFHWCKYYR